MPLLSRLLIRTALLWLGVGFTVGGLVLTARGLAQWPWLWTLLLAHVHMLFVGWMVQLAFGVAFWILPRLDASGNRGRVWPVWLCYGALNGGVVCAALSGPLSANAVVGRGLAPVAGGLYLLAVGAFVVHSWPRVLPFRNLPRPGRNPAGEQ